MPIVYLNGDFLPAESAHISVLDRGLLFADSIYEMIPVYAGRSFALAEHIKRLAQSCEAIKLPLAIALPQWQSICNQLIAKNHPNSDRHKIYIQLTRGALNHFNERQLACTPHTPPTLIAQCIAIQPPSLDTLSGGYHVITHRDTRREQCHIKSTSLLANVLIQHTVMASQADEAILIRDGYVTEGNSSNVFLVKNQQLITPPLSPSLLGGITRNIVIEIARSNQIPVLEIPIPENQLSTADEIWITSSTREIVPVSQLNHQPTTFNPDTSLWKKMLQLYRTHIADLS